MTKSGVYANGINVLVGSVSVLLALTGGTRLMIVSGWVYPLIGLFRWILGKRVRSELNSMTGHENR